MGLTNPLTEGKSKVLGQFQRHACSNAGLDFLIYFHTLLTILFIYHVMDTHTLLITYLFVYHMVDSHKSLTILHRSLILFSLFVYHMVDFHKSLFFTDHLYCFFTNHCSCKILHVHRIDSHNTAYSSVYVLCYKLSHTLF